MNLVYRAIELQRGQLFKPFKFSNSFTQGMRVLFKDFAKIEITFPHFRKGNLLIVSYQSTTLD